MAEVSEHVSEYMNIINVFYNVNSILYLVTNIHPRVAILLKLAIFFVVKTYPYSR